MRLLIPPLLFAVAASAQITITPKTGQVDVAIGGKPFTSFYYGIGVTKPYLYPLRTVDGTILTRGWPKDPRDGERHDHIHHRGVWFAHSDVNGIDFWNSDPSYTKPLVADHPMGHIEVTTLAAFNAQIRAQLVWKDPSGTTLLTEDRTMIFHNGNPRFIDFDITLTAHDRVVFGDDKDGVFGLRLAPELEETLKDAPGGITRTGVMTGSNGCHMEKECWGSRGNWIDVSGQVAGKTVGVAIFDHPVNPRHPTYWHVRGYGLLAANIFGVKAFTHDIQANGSLTLLRGEKLRFQYRLVLHSGNARQASLDAYYNNYTQGGSRTPLR
jgi:hypothetical protein